MSILTPSKTPPKAPAPPPAPAAPKPKAMVGVAAKPAVVAGAAKPAVVGDMASARAEYDKLNQAAKGMIHQLLNDVESRYGALPNIHTFFGGTK